MENDPVSIVSPSASAHPTSNLCFTSLQDKTEEDA